MFDKLVHKILRVPYRLRTRIYRQQSRKQPLIVLLHGLGGSSGTWRKLTEKLPEQGTVIAVDLLGFGTSPQPKWSTYDVPAQARSVAHTLRISHRKQPVILVGHSLGALVAVEIAKKHPDNISQLVLCSPPFYKPEKESTKPSLPTPDAALRSLYRKFGGDPKRALGVLSLASRLGVINEGFRVDQSNIASYLATLEMAIINQPSYDDMQELTTPTTIITGSLDPLIITSNVKRLAKNNQHIIWRRIAAGHEIKGPIYLKALTTMITNALKSHP